VHLASTNISNGWLTFPGGQLSTDPSADLTPPPNSFIDRGPSYNWRFSRWVPVSWYAQSPDFSSYAYGTRDGLHVVDAETGADRLIAGTRDLWMNIIKFEPEGIYAQRLGGGLWRINPSTGSAELVLNQGSWLTVGHGAAWGFTPATVGVRSLVRADVRDASTALWYTRAPVTDVFGVDSTGRPVIAVATSRGNGADMPMQIMVLSGPEEGDIFHPTDGPWNLAFFENGWQASTDSHGVWVPWPDGIYLLASGPGLTLRKVTDGPNVPAGTCN
jgi:hypothetical protein